MVKKSIVDYIRNQIQKGHNLSAIRNILLKYGYTNKDIDEALNEVYHPTIRHEIHLSRTTIFVIIFVFVSLVGAALFVYYPPKGHAKLLDLNLEPIKTTAMAGESIIFIKEISNLGSLKRYDVVIKQEILDPRTFKPITEKTETRAIETLGSTQTRIEVPPETMHGDYVLRVIIDYDGKKAVATLPVKILTSSRNETVKAVEMTKCEDTNSCTEDMLQDDVCVHKPIVPCCGNSICEESEKQMCKKDCPEAKAPETKTPETPIEPSPHRTIEEIKELAKTNPKNALEECGKIEVGGLRDECISKIGEAQRDKTYCSKIGSVRTKDICYSNIARYASDSSICEEISTDGIKDSCYMTFAINNKDYSVCSKIINKQQRQSCDYLRQLSELNQKTKT